MLSTIKHRINSNNL